MEYNKESIKDNRELRRAARQQLKGNWGLAVLLVLVYMIVTGAVSYIGGDRFAFIGSIIGLILSGPFELGLVICFLTIVRTQKVRFESLFDGFKKFGDAFLVQLLRTIFVLLWGIPAFILGGIASFIFMNSYFMMESPGVMFWILVLLSVAAFALPIIASYKYALAFYILNDNPGIGSMGALRASKEMMQGYKAKLFLLHLSFIGWVILGIIALLIGLLWVTAYMSTAQANFYENLKQASGSTNSFQGTPYIQE
jgi:uncharacterized membrane protein